MDWEEEIRKAGDILQRNRHSSALPFKWFGPDPEPQPAGPGCSCPGCDARKIIDGR